MALIREGGARCGGDVVENSAVVLDFDNGRTIEDVQARLEGVEYALYTTHSHRADAPKFRVVLPMSRPVSGGEWLSVWRAVVELVGGGVDSACKDPSRFFWLPSCPEDHVSEAYSHHQEGRWLDSDELVALGPERGPAAPLVSAKKARDINDDAGDPPVALVRVRAALAGRSAHGRGVCVRVIQAIAWDHGSAGEEVAREFCAKDQKFTEEWFLKEWKDALKRAENRAVANPVTCAWIIYEADKNGPWPDPAKTLTISDDAGAGDSGEAGAAVVAADGNEVAALSSTSVEGTPGDLINARMFAKRVAGRLLYDHASGKWLLWDELRWRWATKGEEVEISKEVAQLICDSAMRQARDLGVDTPAGRRWATHAVRTLREGAIKAMLALACSDPALAIGSAAELDADPDKLAVRNGTVYLPTGELRPACPSDLITRMAEASFVLEAQCPRWRKFLRDVFGDDPELIAFVQRMVGYLLTGHVNEEVLFFLCGFGSNGKSVFANVLTAILAAYAITAPASMLTARRDASGPREDVARLAGARMINANETQAGERLDDQLIKTLVSREPLAARFLYGSTFEFRPTGKLLIRGNHKPIIVGDDNGIWRRILLVMFPRTFEGAEVDRDLESKLLEERDGILMWAIEGAVEWYRTGLRPPASVTNASADYRKESDVLGQFLDEECVVDPDGSVVQATLYDEYRRWVQSGGFRPTTKAQFTRRLAERGYPTGEQSRAEAQGRRRVRVYRGLRRG
jgi:putative DNA primase/helicase